MDDWYRERDTIVLFIIKWDKLQLLPKKGVS